MSERTLVAHPSATPTVALGVVARAERVGTALSLHYRLAGDLPRVALPPPARGVRTDRLWEHTCFEAFVGFEGHEHYVEINFSPSTAWAAYAFDGYRLGMRTLPLEQPPVVEVAREARALTVTGSVDLAALPDARSPWRVGLTAVVESADGARSYWALRHAEKTPDFHRAAGFEVRLTGQMR
jgi:hypothetical protein